MDFRCNPLACYDVCMDPPNHSLSNSLRNLAGKLDQQEIIPLARVFGSSKSTPSTARDIDLAFFCPHPYASDSARKFFKAVSEQVLVQGNRHSGHYGELDVFVFFPDRSLVRNDECNGWALAKKGQGIKAAAEKGKPWLDFMSDTVPDWDRESCPPHRLRTWVCKESPYPLDGPTIESMVRVVASFSPWIANSMYPRNVITEAIEWGHLSLVPLLIAAGAPVMPEMPEDPDDLIDYSGEPYYPSVASLVRARHDMEDEGLESMVGKMLKLIGIAEALVKAGADPLRFDLGGNAANTLEVFQDLAINIQSEAYADDCDVPTCGLPEAMASLADTIFASLPTELSAMVYQDVCSGAIDEPGHELNRLAKSPAVMGPWLAGIRYRSLSSGVATAASPSVALPRM